jgi:hypothetical protein
VGPTGNGIGRDLFESRHDGEAIPGAPKVFEKN